MVRFVFIWFCFGLANLMMLAPHTVAQDLPDNPTHAPFPHPVCLELLVGSTVDGPLTTSIDLEACGAWADYMPAADWGGLSHVYYRGENSDDLPGGMSGYLFAGWTDDNGYILITFDTGGGNGLHTALLVAHESQGKLTTSYTRRFGDRCNGELMDAWDRMDGSYGVEVSATPKAILTAAGLQYGSSQYDARDCPSCCIGHLRAVVDPHKDEVTYTEFVLTAELISPVLSEYPKLESAFKALADQWGEQGMSWDNLADALVDVGAEMSD